MSTCALPRWFVAILFCFLSACTSQPSSPAAKMETGKRPNVLLILCDDLRWDCLGIARHPHLKTPHIDRLAREGVYFRNAFCTTSLCSPSRASILSGLYAHSHGVTNNFTEYPNHLGSFPRVLQSVGYDTGYIGKYHMGENNDEPRPGFDYFVTHKGQGKYFDTEFNINGQKREVVKGYYTQVVTDMAIEFLSRKRPAMDGGGEGGGGGSGGDKPFMLILGHKAPHSFYFPEPKYEHAFDHVDVQYPDTAFKLDNKPDWIKKRLPTWHGIYGPLFDYRKKFPDSSPEAVKDFAAMTRAYWGTIRSIDDSVGRIYDHLEKSGQLDNTLIIFMGDNGLLNGEHGMVDKRTMHEASIRVPIVMRLPASMSGGGGAGAYGLRASIAGSRIDQQVLTLDIAPSILDLCAAPALPKIHGRSFKALAQRTPGAEDTWRKSWYYEYNYEKQFPYTPNVRGVRTDEWKYIHYPTGVAGKPDEHKAELYRISNDPEERRNLIDDPKQAGVVAQLKAELAKLMDEAGVAPGKDAMPVDEGVKSELPDLKIR